MIKYKFLFYKWAIDKLERLLAHYRANLKEIILTGGSFHFEEGSITGTELDDEEPSVHVVPTYYDYDAAGEASGDVNERFKLGD